MLLATLLILLLSFSLTPQTVVWAADIVPVPPVPSVPPPSDIPPPEVPPSPHDPGIVKQPETVPQPGSVVTPPVVDPKMAVNPDEPRPQEPALLPRESDPRQSPGQPR
jgi:hypothetical protein